MRLKRFVAVHLLIADARAEPAAASPAAAEAEPALDHTLAMDDR
jgi:hypothetical protein